MSDELAQIKAQVLDPKVVKTMGAGKAYQSVATSMAITVQDATDYLRTVSVVCQSAIAVFTAQYVEHATNPIEAAIYGKIYAQQIEQMAKTMEKSIQVFTQMGTAAGNVLKNFPSGD